MTDLDKLRSNNIVNALTDFGFHRILSRQFVRFLYLIGVIVIILNAIMMVLGSAFGISGIGISINGFDGSEFFTSSDSGRFTSTPASVLLSLVLYAALAIFEITMLRVLLEMVTAITSTASAWERIRSRNPLDRSGASAVDSVTDPSGNPPYN